MQSIFKNKSIFFRFVLSILVFAAFAGSGIQAQEITYTQSGTGFFYPTGTSSFGSTCGTWLGRDSYNGGCYYAGSYHIGFDMMTAYNMPVYAVSPGTVVAKSTNGWEGINVGLLIKHTLSDGTQFNALYGHILTNLNVGDRVHGGVEIGRIGAHSGGNHLHFGVTSSSSTPPSPWGAMPNSSYPGTNGFVDPLNWITTRAPKCENGTSERYLPFGGAPVHPDGTLIKTAASGTVYVLEGNVARPISSAQRLWELYGPGRGFGFQDVITISQQEMNLYLGGAVVNDPLPYNGRSQPDGRLIKQSGSGEISIVTDNGTRRVFSGQAFLRLGYSPCNVAVVSDYNSYPRGADITY
jgi:hypothetical protein